MTKCLNCGRDVPGIEDCECGYRLGWIQWSKSVHDLRITQGWRELKCPPSSAFPKGVAILVHPDQDCEDSCCRFYPIRHRHRADDVEEIVRIEEDKPGGANRI